LLIILVNSVVILFIAFNYLLYPQNTKNSHFHQIIHPISPNHTLISIRSVTINKDHMPSLLAFWQNHNLGYAGKRRSWPLIYIIYTRHWCSILTSNDQNISIPCFFLLLSDLNICTFYNVTFQFKQVQKSK
jgi:hypothetical protein